MVVLRVTTLPVCVRYWPFFAEGFATVEKFLRYGVPVDVYRQILFTLVKTPTAWVGLVVDDQEKPLGFGVAHECTPMFSANREYEASVIYAKDNDPAVLAELQFNFENFCRAQGVKTYYATTRRDSGATIRCFQSPRYGFRRAYTVFKKEII